MAPLDPILLPERRERAKAFAQIKYRLRLIRLLILVLYLAALIAGGAAALWTAFPHPLLFVGALFIIKMVIDLPLDYYSHRLARQYELSVQSLGGWLMDQTKSFLVGLLLGGALGWVILALWARHPQTWYLWVAGGAVIFNLLLTFVAPVLIAPLFHKYTPLPEGELRTRLMDLSHRAGVFVKGVFVADVSRKETALNASLSGLGSTRRIVLYDTLVEALTPEEVEVVMAHEMGHHVYNHILQIVGLSTLFIGGLFVIAGFVVEPLSAALGLGGLVPAALPLVLLLFLVGGITAMPIMMAISRRWERDCDRYALKMTANPAAFIAAFRKLADKNLADLEPPAWVYYFLYSHPPIPERVAMAEGWRP